MSATTKALNDELRKLGHEIHTLVKDTDAGDWSTEHEEKFQKMETRHQAIEKQLERMKAASRFSAPEMPEAPADLPPGVEVIETDDPERRAKGGEIVITKPKWGPEFYDLAFRGWAMGQRGNDELMKAARDLGYDLQRDQYDFSQSRGRDEKGYPIRYPMSPPSIRGNRVRPREAQDIHDLYEKRQVGIGTPVAGPGSNTVPDEMMRPLEIALLNVSGMREMSTIIQTSTGAPLPIPQTNDTTNEGRLIAEHDPSTDVDIVFDQLVLNAFKYGSDLVRTSFEFLQDTSIDSAATIGRLLGERIGRITNRHFTIGDDSGNNPRGITTDAVDSGVVLASTTAVTWEELITLKHSVDAAYARAATAGWMFSWLTLGALKKIKDQNDRPLWSPSLVEGEPSTFDGNPYVINSHFPELGTLSSKAIIFGDLAKYTIRDALGIMMMVLRERFAENAQVGWLSFSRHDGKLNDAGTAPIKFLQTPAA